MAAFFKRKQKEEEEYVEDSNDDYLSITDIDTKIPVEDKSLEVRVFVLDDYENIRDILDIIRGERTMCLIDIHLLRNKDPDELRRSIDKLKKTVNAVNGELVGFHENWIMAAPSQIHIHKGKE